MAISEGVGIVSAGKEAKKRARMAGEKKVASSMSSGSYGGYVDAGDTRGFVSSEQATKMLANPERFKMSPGEIKTLRQNMPVDRVQKDIQSEIRRPSFFSTTQDVKVASSDVSGLDVGDSFTEQASANLADASIYKKKEDTIYRPTDSIYDSLKDTAFPKIEKDTGYGESLEKSLSELSDTSKSIFGIDEKTKEYGVPMSKEEQKATTAYEMTNLSFPFNDDRYKFSDTNYDKIQSDYDKYKDLRDRRQTRKEAEEAVTKFRKDYMKDFQDADYAIKMKQYNPDGTEKDINKYNVSLDEQKDNLNRLRQISDDLGPNYALDRFGNILPRSEVDAYNKKVDAEEAERSRLSKLEAKKNYEDSQKNVFQKVGDFIGRVTRPPAALGAENTLSRTVPSGSFNISQEGKDQAAINRGIKAAEATGIPSGTNLKEGSFGISEKGKQQAAANIAAKRSADAKRMSEAQAIAKRNPNVSIQDGRAVATNQSSTARAQASAVNRKIDGKTVSQVKAENERSMRQKAKERSEAFKAKKQEKAKGFSSPTSSKKSSPSPSKKSTPSKAKSKATAAKKSKSKSTGRGGKKGGGSAGSRGRGGSSRGGRRGGVGRGGRRGGRGGRRCDIFLKYDISPLTNMNLVRDDLAEIAYFVKELQK